MRLHSAAILYNPLKASAHSLKDGISAFLRKRHIRILPAKKAQIIITVSGDGTMLYNKNRHSKPFFGIGSHTSCLCQSRYENWQEDLGKIIENGFWVEKRLMLASSLGGKRLPDALNEVVVRNRKHRLMHIKLKAGGKEYFFRADGIIFCAPTGSGAYAYSCGGRKMPARAKRYQIVAIAPHRREFKPIILDADAACTVQEDLQYHKRIGKDVQAIPSKPDAVVDGQFQEPLKRKDVLKIWKSEKSMELVRAR